MDGPDGTWQVEPLGPQHNRSKFESGVEPLDRYLRSQARQDTRKNLTTPFVLALHDGTIAGYYTLSGASIRLEKLPEAMRRPIPYEDIPATLLGRLAVDRRLRGRGYGRFLLADALHRASRNEIASYAVIVDAKDEPARRFYEREGFLPFRDSPLKLFLTMADIRSLFR